MSDKQKEKLTKIFRKIFVAVLIAFTALYISENAGYFDYKEHNKKIMTEEKIKQFESDVKEGKNIHLEDYVVNDTKNYENKVSKVGESISKKVEKYVVSGLNTTFKFLNGVLG